MDKTSILFTTTTSDIADNQTAQKQPQSASEPTKQAGSNSPQKGANNPKIAPNPINEEEFDLRKAVIYAEILTPKFKDEDF